MNLFATRLIVIGGFVCAVVSNNALAEPEAAKAATGNPSNLNADFWTDWDKTKASPEFKALTSAVASAKSTTASATPKPGNTQTIVNIAIDQPADAAKLMGNATAASKDAVSANALATVVNMVTSSKTREEAAPLVAPEAKARVQAMRANLSTGIQGLPGIYLGDVPHASQGGGGRPAVPQGYAPVSGRSYGCPVR